jgi:uncharacterized DUF497 family protein
MSPEPPANFNIERDIPDEQIEERYVTIGIDALGNVLVVIYTWRGERPRLISARKATPQERERYGEKP